MKKLTRYRTKLAKKAKKTRTTAEAVYRRTRVMGLIAYNQGRKWVANIDKQSIRQYLSASWKVIKNGGGRCSTYFINSYKLSRRNRVNASDTDYKKSMVCLGVVIATAFITCCELLMLIQLLRKVHLVRTTPHNLLLNINARVERLSGGAALSALQKIRGGISKVFKGSAVSNINAKGYSFLSAGVRTKRSA